MELSGHLADAKLTPAFNWKHLKLVPVADYDWRDLSHPAVIQV